MMRLLLLLSALLSSLCGVASGAASAATRVEASATVVDQAGTVHRTAGTRVADGTFPPFRQPWHTAVPARTGLDRPLYADRLRE